MSAKNNVFRLAIKMTDDALANCHPEELAACVANVAAKIKGGDLGGVVIDSYDNNVGRWEISRTSADAKIRLEEKAKTEQFAKFLQRLCDLH